MAAQGATKQYGVTGPLSEALPSDAENQLSQSLIDELRRQNNYETAAETEKRFVSLNSTTDVDLR